MWLNHQILTLWHEIPRFLWRRAALEWKLLQKCCLPHGTQCDKHSRLQTLTSLSFLCDLQKLSCVPEINYLGQKQMFCGLGSQLVALAVPGGCSIALMQPRAVSARDLQHFPLAISRKVVNSEHTNHLIDSMQSWKTLVQYSTSHCWLKRELTPGSEWHQNHNHME